jgi:predicted  nucleic acid-binding Zn-ribbon protein
MTAPTEATTPLAAARAELVAAQADVQATYYLRLDAIRAADNAARQSIPIDAAGRLAHRLKLEVLSAEVSEHDVAYRAAEHRVQTAKERIASALRDIDQVKRELLDIEARYATAMRELAKVEELFVTWMRNRDEALAARPSAEARLARLLLPDALPLPPEQP